MRTNHLEHLTEFMHIEHQNNCLILANELRMHCSILRFPDALMDVALSLDSMDFKFVNRLMNIYGTEVAFNDIQPWDVVLMSFDNQVCLGTSLDDLVFYLGDSGITCNSLSKLGKYFIGAWRPKNFLSDEFRHLMDT
jgi:hypothetical protein